MSIRMPETVAHTAMIQISATSVIAGHSTATTPAARSTTPSRIEQAPPLAVPRRLDAGDDGEHAVDEHIGGEQDDEHLDGDARRAAGKSGRRRCPRCRAGPTAHQLSAKTSLSASQRGSDTTVRPFRMLCSQPWNSPSSMSQVDQVAEANEKTRIDNGAMMKPI